MASAEEEYSVDSDDDVPLRPPARGLVGGRKRNLDGATPYTVPSSAR